MKPLLMKDRTRRYGRDFCEDIEMKCIVKSAPIGSGEYKSTSRPHKLFLCRLSPVMLFAAGVYCPSAFARLSSLGADRARILNFRY